MAGDAGPTAVSDLPETDEPADPGEFSDIGDDSGGAVKEQAGRLRDWLSGPPVRLASLVGGITIAVLAAVAAWQGYLAYQNNQTERERAAFLDAAKRGAVDLTSVDYTHPEADIARLLERSTGAFRDDFQKRSGPFVEEVLRTKTKAVGSVAAAAVESIDGDVAKVLVAVKVHTTREGSPDERDKGWRMRIAVTRVGEDIKVSNVGFVP